MIKNLSIIGSTGSIGTQGIQVADDLNINIVGLTAGDNSDLLIEQARLYLPEIVAINNEEKYKQVKDALKDLDIKVLVGAEGINEVAGYDKADCVLCAIVGMPGLNPVLTAAKKGKRLALANKEPLVTAGEIILNEVNKSGSELIPVDSEHCAIFQCLKSGKRNEVEKIILTASGGPFFGKKENELKRVTIEEALNHPSWSMGNKITIDSATLMNKGFEVIEAKWLFDISQEKIEVIVHPQSIIHSMVEFNDGSIISQMGEADMRIPIQYAFTYPDKVKNQYKKLSFDKTTDMNFYKPDRKTFKCLDLAYSAIDIAGSMPACMNGANEMAVELFLKKRIGFLDIANIIERVMDKHNVINNPDIDDIIEVDKWARNVAGGIKCLY